MVKFKKLRKIFYSGVFLIAFFSILSRLIGFVRDRLLAGYFGAGDALDSYYAAFRLPDLIFNTLIFGALGSAFIPQFVKLWQADKAKAINLANNLINILTTVVILLTILFYFIAPQILPLITPGFSPAKQQLTTSLTKIMLLSIVFFSLSTIMSSILNSLHKYLFYSLAPIFYNFGIIFGIIILSTKLQIAGVAWGVVIGAFLHFLIQLIDVRIAGWRYQIVFQYNHLIKKIFKLMIPRTIGLLANQINQIIITLLSSLLKSGSLSIFNFAINIQYLPITIFGISLSTVSFPYFSQYWAQNDHKNFQNKLIDSFRQILFFTIPLTLFMLLFRNNLVNVLLGAGRFDLSARNDTSIALAYFCLSIFAQSLLPVITKAFYAQEDTKTPVIISVISIILNIVLSLILMKFMALNGLILSFSIAAIFNFYCLYIIIKKRINLKTTGDLKIFCGLIFLISLIAVWLGYLILIILNYLIISNIFTMLIIKLFLIFLIFFLSYYKLAVIFKIKEIGLIKEFFNHKNATPD